MQMNQLINHLVLISSLLLGAAQSKQDQRIIEEPEDTNVIRGNTAVLKCKVYTPHFLL